jgi:hypothetical protein
MTTQTTFTNAIKNNNICRIKSMLKANSLNPSYEDNEAIYLAAKLGHTDVFKLLLEDPRVDPSDMSNKTIITASLHENIDIVKLLIQDKRVDPSARNNSAIQFAENKELIGCLLNIEKVRLKLKENSPLKFQELMEKNIQNKLSDFK